MKKEQQYLYLRGLSKSQIIKEMGHEFNLYLSDEWNYTLKTSWLGVRTILFLTFADDVVTRIKIKKAWKT